MGPNLGGASTVNVWSPLLIPATLLSSASQQWYSTGIVPFVDFQSVECGWRAGVIDGAPADSLPRLFVYYTKKDYLSGQSYYDDYNLTGGFAYTPGASHALHAALSPVSTQGGTQYDIRMGFSLTGGRWWFHHAGTWIGSYAAAEFAPGTLAVSAADASFGGETTTGFGTFPVMGSGRFPAEGCPPAQCGRERPDRRPPDRPAQPRPDLPRLLQRGHHEQLRPRLGQLCVLRRPRRPELP